MNTQERLLGKIRAQLNGGTKLVEVLEDVLSISTDAAYRRIRSEVLLTIDETISLCKSFDISFDDLVSRESTRVSFNYRNLGEIEEDYLGYLDSLCVGIEQLSKQPNQQLYASVNDTPIFQMFHFPKLTAFKFYFWSKCFLHPEKFKETLFNDSFDDIRINNKSQEILYYYNQIPSSEVYCPEALRGLLRQIKYCFDSSLFEQPKMALALLDDLSALAQHIKEQAENGVKMDRSTNGENRLHTKFDMYVFDTYLPDNSYFFKSEKAKGTYFSHNIMNYIFIDDERYNKDTELILDQLLKNSTLISNGAAKERNSFFSSLQRIIEVFRSRIEAELDGDI